MAKFKRYDPQNKKADKRKEHFANAKTFNKRNRLIGDESKAPQKYNAKTLYTFENEVDL
jgi:hypothetical protein